MGVLHGRVWGAAGVPVLVGLDAGAEALADGHHLFVVRAVRGGGVRVRVRAAGDCGENGGDAGHQ